MILTVTSQKGGVGKTTAAQNLAAGLQLHGRKALLIDADPQSNLTYSVGIDPDKTEYDLSDVMRKKVSAAQAIITTGEMDVLPGSYTLSSADVDFTQTGREYMLSEALEPITAKYDFIIIDTPPTLGILTINALTASNAVLIPMTANIYSIQGLAQLYNAIGNVKRYCNKGLTIDGLLLNRYRQANISKETKEAIDSVAENIGGKLYKTTIREGIAVTESQSLRMSLFKAAPRANVTADYAAFVEEFIAEH